jgi:hypothetical protein
MKTPIKAAGYGTVAVSPSTEKRSAAKAKPVSAER